MDDIETNMIKFVIKNQNFLEYPISDAAYEHGSYDKIEYKQINSLWQLA